MRLSLRWKIAGGFGLLILLMVLLGWVTLSLFGSVRSVQRRVFDDAVPGVIAIDEIVHSYEAQLAHIRGYLISSRDDLLAAYETEVRSSRAAERRARSLFTSARERELLDRLVAAGAEFHELVDDDVVPPARRGQRSLAFSALENKGAELIAAVQDNGERLRTAQRATLMETEDQVASRSNQAVIILVVVLVGVVLTGVMVAILFPKRLSQNLARLVDAARAIGGGNLNQRIEIRSGDEVEELAGRFEEMQEGLRRLQQLALQDRELQIAGSIQQNLLQRTMPEPTGARLVPLQRQANLVGGDWYDIDVERRTMTAVVGDASGKGIGAALMATITLSVLRAERSLGSVPQRVVARANQALVDATDPDSFTTMVYATLHLDNGDLRWLNMGHPPPYVLGPTGGRFLEGPRNRALGWFDDPGTAENVDRLEPGDRLILYTDGFLEAKSPDGEIFGEGRFAAALHALGPLDAEAIGAHVVGEVERFAAGKLDDDLTMLIVEFEGAPAGDAARDKLTGEEPWHSRR